MSGNDPKTIIVHILLTRLCDLLYDTRLCLLLQSEFSIDNLIEQHILIIIIFMPIENRNRIPNSGLVTMSKQVTCLGQFTLLPIYTFVVVFSLLLAIFFYNNNSSKMNAPTTNIKVNENNSKSLQQCILTYCIIVYSAYILATWIVLWKSMFM